MSDFIVCGGRGVDLPAQSSAAVAKRAAVEEQQPSKGRVQSFSLRHLL